MLPAGEGAGVERSPVREPPPLPPAPEPMFAPAARDSCASCTTTITLLSSLAYPS